MAIAANETQAVPSLRLSGPRPLDRTELVLILLAFGVLAGANGVTLAFNSAGPCGLIATALLSIRIFASDGPIRLSAFEWAVAGSLVVWCVGAAVSALFHPSHQTLLNFYAGYLVPLLLFGSLVKRPITDEQKCWILLAVAVGATIPWGWGIVAYVKAFGIPSIVDLFWNRYDVSGMATYHQVAFGNTSHIAHYLSIALPPLLVMAASASIPVIPRSIFGIAGLLGLINLLLIASRGAVLTLLLLLLFWMATLRSPRLVAATTVLIAILAWLLNDMEDASFLLYERTLGALSGDALVDPSINERFESIAVGWRLFLEHPLLGVGPGLSYTVNEWSIAHQLIVEQAASIGIFGLAAITSLTLLVIGRSTQVALFYRTRAASDLAFWSGILGWTFYGVIAGGLLNLGLLSPWAGLLYGFLAVATAGLSDTRKKVDPHT